MRYSFVIAGTQKGGTTALAQFLKSHPQICFSSVKETHFFDLDENYYSGNGSPDYDRYHGHLEECSSDLIGGEATPIYMYLPFVAERMRLYDPGLKIILILRDPSIRAYSHYQMEYRRGNERLQFWQALLIEWYRLKRPELGKLSGHIRAHSYMARGFYWRQIRNLLQAFPRDQLLLLRNEELANDHAGTLRKTFEFLGVDAGYVPDKSRVFEQKYDLMPRLIRRYLVRRFSRDIDELEKFTGWDLTDWHSW